MVQAYCRQSADSFIGFERYSDCPVCVNSLNLFAGKIILTVVGSKVIRTTVILIRMYVQYV